MDENEVHNDPGNKHTKNSFRVKVVRGFRKRLMDMHASKKTVNGPTSKAVGLGHQEGLSDTKDLSAALAIDQRAISIEDPTSDINPPQDSDAVSVANETTTASVAPVEPASDINADQRSPLRQYDNDAATDPATFSSSIGPGDVENPPSVEVTIVPTESASHIDPSQKILPGQYNENTTLPTAVPSDHNSAQNELFAQFVMALLALNKQNPSSAPVTATMASDPYPDPDVPVDLPPSPSGSGMPVTASVVANTVVDTPLLSSVNGQQVSLERSLDTYVTENGLTNFFKPGGHFLQDLAREALSKDPSSIYIDLDNAKRLAILSLYQLVVYCDDSGSMENEKRFEQQADIVIRICDLATKILPKDCCVDLCFMNDSSAMHLPSEWIPGALRHVRPNGGTRLGTSLRSKILAPLVYKILDSDEPLTRPFLICAITDGYPYDEPDDTFKKAIIECRSKLLTMGYEHTAVKFLIGQIGGDFNAARFLDKLRNDAEINDVLYCTPDRLDERLRELRAAESRLEEWLLRMLTSAMIPGK